MAAEGVVWETECRCERGRREWANERAGELISVAELMARYRTTQTDRARPPIRTDCAENRSRPHPAWLRVSFVNPLTNGYCINLIYVYMPQQYVISGPHNAHSYTRRHRARSPNLGGVFGWGVDVVHMYIRYIIYTARFRAIIFRQDDRSNFVFL